MGKIIHRPGNSVHYGSVSADGGNVLGDNNINTVVYYDSNAGSINVYGTFNGNSVPAGREIIAVRVAHNQAKGGLLGLYNGWVASYLRINNQKIENSYNYKQQNPGNVYGPPIYKSSDGSLNWTADDINRMSTECGAATGAIGPNTSNRWTICTEIWIEVIYNDPVPTPVASTHYPANGAVVNTSSVPFGAALPAPQAEQPVRAVFQVARDNQFTQDVRTFIGSLNSQTVAGSRSTYTSTPGKDSYTDLGPGLWYMRSKGRDYTNNRESGWSSTTTFTVTHGTLPVPQISAPASGETVANPYAIRSAVIPTVPQGERIVGVEWQFAWDTGFTDNVVSWQNRKGLFRDGTVSYDPSPSKEVAPGQYGPVVSIDDPSQYLRQKPTGTWYARVRCVDKYGQTGPWSGITSFTIDHKPYASNFYPRAGQAFDQNAGNVTWDFSDPYSGDRMTAYQLIVTDLNNNVLQDTGKVASLTPAAKMNVGPGRLQQQLRYSVALWDLDDIKSTVNPTQNFFMSMAPIITLVWPAESEVIPSGQPSITWSSQFARAGVTQKSYKVTYIESRTQTVAYTTGVITGAVTSHTPPRAVLKNLTEYQLQLTVTDTDDLSSTLKRNFVTDFERPAGTVTTVDGSNYDAAGYVTVRWDADVDPFFAEWRVYRKKVDEYGYAADEWEYAGTVENVASREFKDWLVAGTATYRYSVTQVAYRYGSMVESSFDEYGERVSILGQDYWLICPEDETLNVRLLAVVGDKFTEKRESNQIVIMGGGRRINYGTKIGKDGTLTCQIRDSSLMSATQQLQVLDYLCNQNISVLMRDPFGNVTKIAIGEVSVDRMAGVGNNEYANIEIPYYEVK